MAHSTEAQSRLVQYSPLNMLINGVAVISTNAT